MNSKITRKPYHHGNLAAAALDAAGAIVRESGHEGLSLRQVASATGVAHRSLYNHFADREALLDALAARGFNTLAGRLRKADSARAFIAAWVEFSRADTGLYALMTSRPHATMKDKPALQASVHLVIGEAMRVFGTPIMDAQDRRRAVMQVFILIYGALALYRSGVLDMDGEDALISELSAMTQGLRFRPPRGAV